MRLALFNIFIVSTKGYVVSQHLHCIHKILVSGKTGPNTASPLSSSSSPFESFITSSISSLSVYLLIKFSSPEMTPSVVVPGGWKSQSFSVLFERSLNRSSSSGCADFCCSFKVRAFAKQLMVELFTFCHAKSMIFIASKIEKNLKFFSRVYRCDQSLQC